MTLALFAQGSVTIETGTGSIPFPIAEDSDAARGAALEAAVAYVNARADEDSADGIGYLSGLTRGSDGLLYGIAEGGGNSLNAGAIFRLHQDGSGFERVCQLPGAPVVRNSRGALVEDSNGDFWGAGPNAIFKVSKSGTLSVVYTLNGSVEGNVSYGALCRASDGFFYGVAYDGGSLGKGTLWRISGTGTSGLELLRILAVSDGQNPMAAPAVLSDGRVYGTCSKAGGSGKYGTLWRMEKDGSGFEVLHAFSGGTTDGRHPWGGVTEVSGTLYGVTFGGGASNFGTLYRCALDGSGYTVVKHFDGPGGKFPINPPRLFSDGNLYGVCREGGAWNCGVAYQLSVSGSYSVLVSGSGAYGDYFWGAPVEGADGKLIFASQLGGAFHGGAILACAPENSGMVGSTLLHSAPAGDFPCTIKLGPGVYETSTELTVSANYVHVQGAGIDQTVLRRGNRNLRTGGRYVLQFHKWSHSVRHHVECSDLTVDCNVGNLNYSGGFMAAVSGYATDAIIQRIRAINFGYRPGAGGECFVVSLGVSGGADSTGTPNTNFVNGMARNNVIQDVTIEYPAQATASYMTLCSNCGAYPPDLNGPSSGWSIDPVVRRLTIRNICNQPVRPFICNGITVSASDGAQVVENSLQDLDAPGATNQYTGMYEDSFSVRNYTIARNTFVGVKAPVNWGYSGSPVFANSNVHIEDNVMTAAPYASANGIALGSGTGGSFPGLTIQRNRIAGYPNGILLRPGMASTGIVITSNTFATTRTTMNLSANVVSPLIWGNRFDSGDLIPEDQMPRLSKPLTGSYSSKDAVVAGTVDPHGYPVTAWIEYGTGAPPEWHALDSTILPGTSGTTVLSGTLSGLKPRTAYRFRTSGSNAFGVASSEESVFTTRNTFTAWSEDGFPGQPDAPEAAPLADPDGDGPNFLEYALGTDPHRADLQTPSARSEDGSLALEFTRPTDREDVEYVVEVADSLDPGAWKSGPGVTGTTTVQRMGDRERVVVRSLLPQTTGSRQFIRLRVGLR